jgi:hypothetical protein
LSQCLLTFSEKIGVFLQNHCYDQFSSKTSSSCCKKTPIFFDKF